MSINLYVRPKRKIDRIFIHCSASDVPEHDNIATIKKWHLARGFNDIGYHYLIHKNGKISKGRDVEKTPAAQKGHNVRTIAVCLHGLHKDNFTQAQFQALKSLCIEIDTCHLSKVSFHGHCEVSVKACPVIDYTHILKLDRFGSLGLNPPEKVTVDLNFPKLKIGDRGKDVSKLQKLLKISETGEYDDKTLEKVTIFKKEHGLYTSGIITKQVWKLLAKPVLDNVKKSDFEHLPDLKTGSRGESVVYLQELLFLNADGIFGPVTAREVREFKKKHNFYPSDIVQKHIWKLLLETRHIEHYD